MDKNLMQKTIRLDDQKINHTEQKISIAEWKVIQFPHPFYSIFAARYRE